MLLLATLASAGTWPVCAKSESTANVHAGWQIVELRENDSDEADDVGSYSSSVSLMRRFMPRRDEEMCASLDGMGGATRRWSSGLMAIDALPTGGSCVASVWAEGSTDADSSVVVDYDTIGAQLLARVETATRTANTAVLSVDGGTGSQFIGEWAYATGGKAAAVVGRIAVDELDAYAGASLEIPGWALVEAYEGEVEAWVRRGDTWEHLSGQAPMTIDFGAVVAPRGSVCATGSVTTGAHSSGNRASASGGAIRFTVTPQRTADPVDLPAQKGPSFEPCGC